ncbi:MAG: methylated-DNA--[protein]-cysteine S-methyltransferase [Gammaproteobacteria bacterium]
MRDYDRIADAINFIARHMREQPSLNETAAHVNLSPFHFQRLFCRWAGITPKRFLQVLTLEHAKQLLSDSRALLDVSESLGLSSASRLHDHFVQLEAVTPGEYKKGGAGLVIDYGVHDTPFGNAFIAVTPRGICSLSFMQAETIDAQLADLQARWPHAALRKRGQRTRSIADAVFGERDRLDRPLSLHVSGTNFQTRVWRALLQIPAGKVVSYGQVATAIDRPRSARAVGRAIGANPVAFLIPCHRVIQQTGKLGGYRWGELRKRTMLAWEAARDEPLPR